MGPQLMKRINLLSRLAQQPTRRCIVLGVLASTGAIAASTQSTPAPGQGTHVTLLSNVAISSSQGQLHSVSLRYSFPGQDLIRVSGLGEMPPSGDLSYMTPDTEVRFLDKGGTLLEAVSLKDATQLMGGSETDTPARSE